MEYREIVAVTGLGGLYQLLATKSDGAIVRNITDKSTKFIPARLHNVTPLESIEIYTVSDNVRLHEVLQKIKDNETAIPMVDVKTADNNAIKKYFKDIFPDFDDERVYVSDMKKMLKWYDLLKAGDLLHFESLTEEAPAETTTAEAEPAPAKTEEPAPVLEMSSEPAEKPVKKARAKKAAPAAEGTEGEEKPAKKAAKKKKEDKAE